MKFDIKEIENLKVLLPTPEKPFQFGVDFDSPISPRENYRRFLNGKGEWMPTRSDTAWFCPDIIPDNIARAFVIQGTPYDGPVGGKDMFNIEWEFVPSARGSIVRPGNPTLTDISKWQKLITFPDVTKWDWEGNAEKTREYLKNSPKYQSLCLFTGWFERLISWMDFGPAAYALMNKKQQPYAKEIFDKLSDLYIQIIDLAHKYYAPYLDGFCIHDDWGAQHAPFFNSRVVREMLVPYMKKVTDHIHDLGYKAELHSCGKLLTLITCIEEAGWDMWQGMPINDYKDAYANLTTKLIMNVNPEGDVDSQDDEVIKMVVKNYLDDFGDKTRPAVVSVYSRNPKFFIELYKQSREKFGE